MGSRGASSGRRGGGGKSITYNDIFGLSAAYDSRGRFSVSQRNEKKQAAFREIAKAPIGTKITDNSPGVGGSGKPTYEIVSYRGGKGIRATYEGAGYSSRRGYKISGASSLYKVFGASDSITVTYPKARAKKS